MNILLDLDGVLANFLEGALIKLNKACNKNITQEEYVGYNTFDMEKVFGLTSNDFWRIIDNNDFWLNLQPFPWAKDLFKYLEKKGKVTICTSPSENPSCPSQKAQWVKKHLNLNNSDLMIGSRKYLMAKFNNVLIDDYPKNIEKFGQNGILIPSNWNTKNLNYEDIIKTIENKWTNIIANYNYWGGK